MMAEYAPKESSYTASEVRVKCFVEGVQFPLVSGRGTVANSSGAPIVMQIQIVTAGNPRFLGRSYVQLFYYDSRDYPVGIVLFEGELMGYTFYSMGGVGATVLNCVSAQSYQQKMLLNILSQRAGAYVDDSDYDGPDMKKEPSTVGERYSSFAGGTVVPDYRNLQKAMFTKSITQPNTDGILGGLVHVMELFTGIQKGQKRTEPADGYVGFAEYRLNLLQRIMAPSGDKTIERLMKLGSTKKFLRNLLKSMRGSQPLSFDLLKSMLLTRMHYQSIVSTASKFVPDRTETREVSVYKGIRGCPSSTPSQSGWTSSGSG